METAASFEARFAPWSYPADLPATIAEMPWRSTVKSEAETSVSGNHVLFAQRVRRVRAQRIYNL